MAPRTKRTMWRSIGTTISGSVRLQPDLAIAIVFVLALAGCSKPANTPAKASPTYTLRQVELPNLSRAAPSVQQQLRDGYDALRKKIDAPSVSSDDLAAAYGQMGMLFMAAEYRDEAESALLNAQTFNPRDARWPYY